MVFNHELLIFSWCAVLETHMLCILPPYTYSRCC